MGNGVRDNIDIIEEVIGSEVEAREDQIGAESTPWTRRVQPHWEESSEETLQRQ